MDLTNLHQVELYFKLQNLKNGLNTGLVSNFKKYAIPIILRISKRLTQMIYKGVTKYPIPTKIM